MAIDLEERKDAPLLLATAAVVLLTAAVFALAAEAWHVFVLTLAGLGMALANRRPIRFSDRSLIYGLVLALVAAGLSNLVFRLDTGRYGLVSGMARAQFAAPFLVYAAAGCLFFRVNAYSVGAALAASFIAMTLAGDLEVAPRMEAKTVPLALLAPHFPLVYASSVMAALTLSCLALTRCFRLDLAAGRATMAAAESAPRRLRRGALQVAALVAAMALAFGGERLYQLHANTINRIDLILAALRPRLPTPSSRNIFGDDVDLNRTTGEHMSRASRQVVIRANSPAPPGYLRGRAYVEYGGGRWKGGGGAATSMSESDAGGAFSFRTFADEPESPPPSLSDAIIEVDVHLAANFSSDIVFAPGRYHQVRLVADTLDRAPDGVLNPDGWEPDGGYRLVMDRAAMESAYPRPTLDSPPEAYLALPPELREELLAIHAAPEGASPAQVLAGALAFLADGFSYSLSRVPSSENDDPILGFLRDDRSGHCELFATAAVLLCRANGVPARYITGFICEEPHPSGDYYVSRLEHCHAWAEAYLADAGGWTLVEATPSEGMPGFGTSSWGWFESRWDQLKHFIERSLAFARRGLFAELVISLAVGAFSLVWAAITNPLGGVPAIAAMFAWMWWRRGRRHGRQPTADSAESIRVIRAALANLLASVESRRGVRRLPAETLDEYTAAIGGDGAAAARLPGLIGDYQRLRYRAVAPDIKAAKNFRREVEEYIDFIKN